MDEFFISVIVPAKNAEGSLGACLDSLQHQAGFESGKNYEIIIVDDGSSDQTRELVLASNAKLISQKNAGPASARNHGARQARGDILAFTDSDCIPAPDWLKQITAPFKNSEVTGVKGVYRTKEKSWIPRFVQMEYMFKYERMKRQTRIDFIDTYSAAYRRIIFLENGGFKEIFPIPSVEDQEFSFRLSNKGYLLVFQPDAVVFHCHDRTAAEYFHRKFQIGYWKALMLRWLPEKTLNDSHTSPSQRWQIGLLSLFLISFILGFVWQSLWLGTLVFFILFGMTGSSLARFIYQHDRAITWIALPMLFIRAAALGIGLGCGFFMRSGPIKDSKQGPDFFEYFVKRGLDILLSAMGMVISAPVLMACAILIKLEDHGPIFFVQERAGKHGRPFRMLKLRTMQVGADLRLHEVLRNNQLAQPIFKIRNDPRVTKIGKCLRRWSLDEIPQLWNIWKGEMSLVGPRPEETWIVAKYSDNQRKRLQVHPGLTGPMQISGRGDLNLDERVALELDYIQKYSVWQDVVIIAKTILVVLRGTGAH